MNRIQELHKTVRQIEQYLRSSDEVYKWLTSKGRSPEEKAVWSELMLNIIILRGKLDYDELGKLADKFDKLVPQLEAGRDTLEKKIAETKEFVKALETVGKLIGLIVKVVTL